MSKELTILEENILILLAGKQLYGLQIIDAFQEATKGKKKIGFGSLYPTLHKLEKKGYIKSKWGEETPEERGGARRKYYTLSGLGEAALTRANKIRTNLEAWVPA